MSATEPDRIEFRLLGSVEAVRDGRTLALGGSRQLALLALLLLEPGRSVAGDRLVDELWHGKPPAGSARTLRAYISRLRSALGADAPITAGGAGFALGVPADRVDAHRFERLTREGREALARGAVRRASERLRAALELWRGRPFDGLADEGALRLEAERLEELRLLALEERIEADLALGQHAELVEDLERLLEVNPYRERLWRQLMLALYRAERQADALAAYRRARTLLDEELGLAPGEELQALERAILRHEVPPVRAPEERHNLPAPVTSFVGRDGQLAQLDRLLTGARLVTLTGVGGVGKTRFALEAGMRVLADFADGVVFVDFSSLAEPALVPAQIATALELREGSEAPLAEQLVRRLREAELLLLLDNCEHLREAACAKVVQSLLAACPRARVLATSREPLGVPGEVDYPVPPLALPGLDEDPAESEAVRLFLARAREARPGLAGDTAALATAARICHDLDGLPLAIELAAAHAKALSLEEIAMRLADRFRFLVSWRRLTAARHRTLQEAMDWSYQLLTEEEQALLARLSVFAGGFTLPAVAAVCLRGDEERALELIGRLVDASLVVAEEREGEMRYRLLETVRRYAADRLDECGETAASQRRRAEYYLGLAESAWELQVANLDLWVERLGREHANLRGALAWSRDSAEPELLLRLAKAVWRFLVGARRVRRGPELARRCARARGGARAGAASRSARGCCRPRLGAGRSRSRGRAGRRRAAAVCRARRSPW